MTTRERVLSNTICRLFGHDMANDRDACNRCHMTGLAIWAAKQPAPTQEDVSAAYWRGVTDGRVLDRNRAFRLGIRYGVRRTLHYDVEKRTDVGYHVKP